MIDKIPHEHRVLTIKEVANVLKVSVQTVKNYIYQGKIKSFKTPGGQHRILESEMNKKLDPSFVNRDMETAGVELKGNDLKELMDVSALIVRAIVRAIEGKEIPLFLGHSIRVAKLCKQIGWDMGFKDEKIDLLNMAGLLHDIGKLNVDDAILSKTEKLTRDEYKELKRHPQFGSEMVEDVEYLQIFSPIIKHHHEWYNGMGYPEGLKEGAIPLNAQIVGLVEAFDVIRCKNKAKGKKNIQDSIDEIKKFENIQFASNLVGVLENVAKKEIQQC
ncbi:MAG: HD domain-containing protein [Elusimicrobia bacterium]|nr:HD domain-containing protein [Elusimicrobiota bacterium]